MILGQLPEKVRLILLRIAAAQQPVTIRRFVEFDTGVMAGSDLFATQTRGQLIQRSKLQTAIAGDTGNRRLSIEITGNKRLHHILLKLAFEIQYIERKAKFFRNPAGIVNIIE